MKGYELGKPPYLEAFPLFYYGGSKKWRINSDKQWIRFHLDRLPEGRKLEAIIGYDLNFMANYESLGMSERRKVANRWLLNFCNENGCAAGDLRKQLFGREVVVSDASEQKAIKATNRLKKALRGGLSSKSSAVKSSGSKILDMADEARGRNES